MCDRIGTFILLNNCTRISLGKCDIVCVLCYFDADPFIVCSLWLVAKKFSFDTDHGLGWLDYCFKSSSVTQNFFKKAVNRGAAVHERRRGSNIGQSTVLDVEEVYSELPN